MNMLNHLLIRASAGTGKTFRLSNRFIHLLSKGVPPRAIATPSLARLLVKFGSNSGTGPPFLTKSLSSSYKRMRELNRMPS